MKSDTDRQTEAEH